MYIDHSKFEHSNKDYIQSVIRMAWSILEAYDFCNANRILYKDATFIFPDSFNQKIAVDLGFGSMGIILFLAYVGGLISENPFDIIRSDEILI